MERLALSCVLATVLAGTPCAQSPGAAPASGAGPGVLVLSDGCELAHTVLLPEGDGPWPAVLLRTPYTRVLLGSDLEAFVRRGYAVVAQDCRGTGHSEGEFVPFFGEGRDGAETLAWVRDQPWCNGSVATYGTSYLGVVQWSLAAAADPPQDAMVVRFASGDVYRDVVHFGGVQSLAIGLSWALTMNARGRPRFAHLPLIEADDASGADVSFWNDWTLHPLLDEFWQPLDVSSRFGELPTPALLVAGWYDLFLPGQLDDFQRRARGGTQGLRLIVGPWDHGGSEVRDGRPDLGEAAYTSTLAEELDFLDHHLRGVDNGFQDRAPVRAFFLGENRWRELDGWPPAAAQPRRWYLRSNGGAAESLDAGVLTESPPRRAEPPDVFVYDPAQPTPSFARDLWRPLSTLSDLGEIAARPDVCTYTSLRLPEPVVIAGPLLCTLYLRSDVADTDLAVTLVDVAPSGACSWRGEGILRARVREGRMAEALLEPGEVAAMNVPMGHIACTFPEGHRIRIHVASSNFPRFARNLNQATPSGLATQGVLARNELLHTSEQDAHLVLWTLPPQR